MLILIFFLQFFFVSYTYANGVMIRSASLPSSLTTMLNSSQIKDECVKYEAVYVNSNLQPAQYSTSDKIVTFSNLAAAGASIYSNSACTVLANTITIAKNIQNSNFFYLKATMVQSAAVPIKVVISGFSTPTSTLNLTVNNPPSVGTAMVRAMWTSDYGAAAIDSASLTDKTKFNSFIAQLQSKGMNRAIVEARDHLATSSGRSKIAVFIRACAAKSIEVELLVNQNQSTIALSGSVIAQDATKAALYQATYCPASGDRTACASAFNVDLEPHSFPSEWSNMQLAQSDYLSALTTIKSNLSGKIKLSAAIGWWYYQSSKNYGSINFVAAILDRGVDRIYPMNYTNNTTYQASRAHGTSAVACAYANKEVISVSDAKDEDPALTFFSLGWTALEAGWTEINEYASQMNDACFKGNAAFDYDDVIAL